MSADPVDPEAVPVSAVARDIRVLIGKLRRRMREGAAAGDFTFSQLAALVRLESDGPATVTALALAEGVRPQTMGANIAALEAAGFVRGAPDPSDGRRIILSLTDAAREDIAATRTAKEEWLVRAIRAHLTPAEQETLATGVELLKRIVDTP